VIETLTLYGRKTLAALRQFTPGQITAIVIGILALIAAAVLLLRVTASPMTPLYSNLSSEDAVAISQELEARGTAFEMSLAGTQILVAPDDVSPARLAMSAAGLPADANSGYSLLDQQGMTTTEFMQNVTFQRALEGELSSTIEGIDGVRSATVHLAIPAESVFTQASDKPTASVLVVMGGGQMLTGEQVQAVANLVSSSVPGLVADKVAVTDSSGVLLSGGGASGAASVEQASRIESSLVASAQLMLDKVLGPGVSNVSVNADLEFDQRSTTTQEYAYPDELPALSVQTNTETYTATDTSATDGPVVGEPPAVIGEGSTTEAQNDYEKTSGTQTNPINSTITERVGAPGTIRRLTVAVLVDAAVPAATFAEVEALVANAVGLDVERGDAIQVSQVAFDTSVADAAEEAAAAALAAEQSGAIFTIGRQVGIALLVLAVIILGALSLRRQRRTMVDLEMLEARGFGGSVLIERLDENGEPVYASADAIAGADGALVPLDEEAIPTYIKSPGSATYDSLRDFATEEPEQVARVLRTWIST
jgi:flagellar M-ring protein FliF